MVVLPLRGSVPDYSFPCKLDGRVYNFRVRWNSRAGEDSDGAGCWFMDVAEEDGTVIATSLALVIGAYIGCENTHPLFRDGLFAARDTSRNLRDATFDDMGGRVEVWYFTMDEAGQEIMASIADGAR